MSANKSTAQVDQVTPVADGTYQVLLTVDGQRREVVATVVASRGVEGVTFEPYPFDLSSGLDPRPVVAAVLAVHRGETP
ncbi:MAG TPA: hypothetical protein VFC00_16250 [Micromonosporaceae bacterium]|nr:hypothetical protein [Micromonosporaceae bacterium]